MASSISRKPLPFPHGMVTLVFIGRYTTERYTTFVSLDYKGTPGVTAGSGRFDVGFARDSRINRRAGFMKLQEKTLFLFREEEMFFLPSSPRPQLHESTPVRRAAESREANSPRTASAPGLVRSGGRPA
jgi:hypothetical protein